MDADYFQSMRLPLTPEDFHRLPRHPAYKYELIAGETWLSPRPRWCHALLDLPTFAAPPQLETREEIDFRGLREADWAMLPNLFAAAFHRAQPYASLSDAARAEASRSALDQTRTGADGPLLESACFIAERAGRPCGAILPTLIPMADLSDAEASLHWDGAAGNEALARREGRPHLTWIFVAPLLAGHGLGSVLLARAVSALVALGYNDLASTFLLGNEQSALWHWRNGFRLLPNPISWREMRRRWRA